MSTLSPNLLLVFASYHVRLGHNVSFDPCWIACPESCSPLFYWLLDFTTHWCASSKIHQNITIQVSFLPSNEHILIDIINRYRWFHAHWPIQFVIAFPIILAGWCLGHQTSDLLESNHYQDPHQKIGLTLLILYCLQLSIGVFVHFFKFPDIFRGYRPPHSYFHVILGLAIIILAQYQVFAASN